MTETKTVSLTGSGADAPPATQEELAEAICELLMFHEGMQFVTDNQCRSISRDVASLALRFFEAAKP